jgi:LmbE family N-acetylglucosaminyl deacetylase
MSIPNDPLRILIIGAHPDDAEYAAGGLAALYCQLGHVVRMVSITNGESGHQKAFGPRLVERRRLEAANAAAIIGAEHHVGDEPDGHLWNTPDLRHRLIRLIRTFKPDLVLTHRPQDYHPDHRATGQAVIDAAYLLTVPAICPETPHLNKMPVFAALYDKFTRPCPFEPTVVVDIASVWEKKIAMLAAHESQFFEWLPYNMNLPPLPFNKTTRHEFLEKWMRQHHLAIRPSIETGIKKIYGRDIADKVQLAEAVEISQYGTEPDKAALRRLFPMIPAEPY